MSVAEDFTEVGYRPIGIGHNSSLRGMLLDQYAAQLRRAEELLIALDRLPEITDDDTLGKVSDFVKQIGASVKTLEGARVAEKEPFLQAGRDVDGVFNTVKDKLDKAKTWVNRRIATYLDEKAKREREARAAEERRQAAEALKARQEAERKAREAEEARQRAEAEARREREAREASEREAAERERKLREEAAAADRRAQEEATKRRQSEENRAKAQAESERLQREADELRRKADQEAAARERQRIADEQAAEARRTEDARQQAERDAEAAASAKAAEEAEAKRLLAEKEALAKPAELARTRSDLGSMATLRTKWTFKVEDREAVDYNQLRAYFSAEAFEKAVNAAIRNGIRPDAEGNQPLKGIRIFQTNEAAVR